MKLFLLMMDAEKAEGSMYRKRRLKRKVVGVLFLNQSQRLLMLREASSCLSLLDSSSPCENWARSLPEFHGRM